MVIQTVPRWLRSLYSILVDGECIKMSFKGSFLRFWIWANQMAFYQAIQRNDSFNKCCFLRWTSINKEPAHTQNVFDFLKKRKILNRYSVDN